MGSLFPWEGDGEKSYFLLREYFFVFFLRACVRLLSSLFLFSKSVILFFAAFVVFWKTGCLLFVDIESRGGLLRKI